MPEMGGGDKDTAFTLPQHISISQKGEHPPIHAKKKKNQKNEPQILSYKITHMCIFSNCETTEFKIYSNVFAIWNQVDTRGRRNS